MSFYHDSKDAALLAGAVFAEHFNTRAELEPNNGWVLVLQPKSLEVFRYPLYDTLEHAEIDMSGFHRLKRRPADHKALPALARAARQKSGGGSSGEPGSAPVKGATAKVWEIADRIFAEKGIDRGAIIAACEAEGINPATAATQFSKWKKTKP